MDIEALQEIALKLKGATQDIKWEHNLCFSVGAKMFLMISLDEIPARASFKTSPEEYDELISRDGILPAPYLARNKWAMAKDINALSKKEWMHYIGKSYALVLAKLSTKVKKEIGL